MENITPSTKYAVNDDADIAGTYLMGYIETYMWYLEELLGKPLDVQQDKVNIEWRLEKEDSVITIYDWKQDIAPIGLYTWHVGGRSTQDITNFLNSYPELQKNWISKETMYKQAIERLQGKY